MRFLKKYRFAVCLALLLTITFVTAVQARRALIGRRAPQKTQMILSGAQAETAEEEKAFTVRPSAGALVRGYSPDAPVWSNTLRLYETHDGCDFSGAEDVFACADGKVERVDSDWLYGLTVRIAHDNGAVSVYASLSEAFVRPGVRVRAGDRIGSAGDSASCELHLGKHLHFEYLPKESESNPCAYFTEAERSFPAETRENC